MTIEEITTKLGKAYSAWKKNEKIKNSLKQEFFEALTGQIDSDTAATTLEYVFASSSEEAQELALKKNPFWKVIGVRRIDDEFIDNAFQVTLEEDLNLKPAAYVNRSDGKVYQRTIVEGAVFLDDEAVKKEDPELWRAISRERIIEEVIPFEELHPEVLGKVSKYLYKGKPEVRFLAPRPAREDELS